MAAKRKSQSLESSLEKIKTIVQQIENGDVDLEKNIALYQDALNLSKDIVVSLNAIEEKYHICQKETDTLIDDLQ